MRERRSRRPDQGLARILDETAVSLADMTPEVFEAFLLGVTHGAAWRADEQARLEDAVFRRAVRVVHGHANLPAVAS